MLGYSYYLAGFLDKGIAKLNKAIKINPNYWDAHYKLGTIYLDMGRYSKAIYELRIAKNFNPDFELTDYKMGLTYYLAGYLEWAEEFLKNLSIKPLYITGIK